MKRIISISVLLINCVAFAQDAPAPQEGWDASTTTTLGIGQMSFNNNWAAGNTDVFSANGNVLFTLNYLKDVEKTARTAFINTFNLTYGIQKPEGLAVQKSADNLQLTSMLARRISSDFASDGDALYLGITATLHTQIAPGYLLSFVDDTGANAYFGVAPNTINPVTGGRLSPRKGLKVSSLMSPGYLWLRAGLRYLYQVQGKDAIYFQFAPVSIKQDYVLDGDIRLSKAQAADPVTLANFDIYGTRGKKISTSSGSTTDLNVQLPLAMFSDALKNLSVASNNILFVSYQDPSIDFYGSLVVKGQINKHIAAAISTDFVYNNEIDTDFSKTGTQTGLQVKGIVNIGLTLQF